MIHFLEELRWRGMLQDMIPGTEEHLSKGMTTGYIGFDPTADSLHVGHLAQIMTLIHFQRAGHKPLVLVGGATGMIGDPSGKSAERQLLSKDILIHHVNCLEKQLKKFLDFDSGPSSALMLNNYDWFKDFRFLDFIRDVGKHITVNYMMAKDSVKKRLNDETGLSFTEFSYQLIQGYDFYHLWKEKNCSLQMGGSDQWGNIVTGTELIRRKGSGSAYAITTPLIKKTDGTKFGKTESGTIWLDPKKTSAYQFYQFWINISDEDAICWIPIFTLKSKEEIKTLKQEHAAAPDLRILQKSLAKEITIRTHSEEALEIAVRTSEFLFENGSLDFLKTLADVDLLRIFEGIPKFKIKKIELKNGIPVIDLLSKESPIFTSKNEATKMIHGGGVFINKNKIHDPHERFDSTDLLNDQYLIIQKGKKNYFLLIAK